LAHGNVTAAQSRQMYSDLQNLPPLANTGKTVDVGERLMFVDCARAVADRGISEMGRIIDALEGPSGEHADAARKMSNAAQLDANVIAQSGNLWYDRLSAALRQPTWLQRSAALAQVDAELDQLCKGMQDSGQVKQIGASGSPNTASEVAGRMLVAILVPAASSSTRVDALGIQRLELVKCGLVLATYRAENGAYPSQLSELTPKYLPQAPLDLFTGQPLIYKPQPNGFLLYSVGLNGKDDGGSGPDTGANQRCDDLIVQVLPNQQTGK